MIGSVQPCKHAAISKVVKSETNKPAHRRTTQISLKLFLLQQMVEERRPQVKRQGESNTRKVCSARQRPICQ